MKINLNKGGGSETRINCKFSAAGNEGRRDFTFVPNLSGLKTQGTPIKLVVNLSQSLIHLPTVLTCPWPILAWLRKREYGQQLFSEFYSCQVINNKVIYKYIFELLFYTMENGKAQVSLHTKVSTFVCLFCLRKTLSCSWYQ